MKRKQIIEILESEFGPMDEWTLSKFDSQGICLSCGEFDYGIEPDAHEYECPACGENKLYGIEEVIMMIA